MTDQLSLRLSAALPNPPMTLRPMLPRTDPEPFDAADHLFQPSWGGLRVLVIIGPGPEPGSGEVVIHGADGTPLRVIPPELMGLGVRVAARSAVLDGELVVVNARGTADQPELEQRLAGKSGRPVAFLAFDILHVDGRSLLNQSLDRRREVLLRTLRPGDEVLTVPAIAGEGRALFDAVAAQGLAGVLARHRSSPYLCGIRSRLWRYIPVLVADIGSGDAEDHSAKAAGAMATTVAGGPVLAVIRRLPLGFAEPDPPASADPDSPGA